MDGLTCLEICAGGGGQLLGLERAGFEGILAVDNDAHATATLARNRPAWTIVGADARSFSGKPYRGQIDLLSAGVPCPPFSVAGRQRGAKDERDLLPDVLRLAEEVQPAALLIENVPGLASARFGHHLSWVCSRLQDDMGYRVEYRVLRAADFGVAQLRPRLILVALRPEDSGRFTWPRLHPTRTTVGESLHDLMAERGWPHADEWREHAASVSPTLVGGSLRHGGPDLGPTRARLQWARLGVDGRGLADGAPARTAPHFSQALVRLTLRMASRLQGFPDSWHFDGGKTSMYRLIGNALPPPVSEAVGRRLAAALRPEHGKRAAAA